jgi:hypothetical protein
MARGGLEPPTPRCLDVYGLHLNHGDLQDFLAAPGGSRASGISRILRRLAGRIARTVVIDAPETETPMRRRQVRRSPA